VAVANLRCEAVRRTCGDMDLNRMVKCQAGDDGTARRMAQREAGESVRFLHVAIEIMTHLRLGDVAVSDESKCLAEALLFEVPRLSVVDWDVLAVPTGLAGTPFDPPEFVQHVPSDLLRRMFQATLADLPGHLAEARRMRDGTSRTLAPARRPSSR
jgi:hypothetical protein